MIAPKYKAALLSLAAAGLLSTPVQAASVSGSVDLKVNMPEILVLYHVDEIEINLADAQAATAATDHVVSETTAAITGTMGAPISAALTIAGTDAAHSSTTNNINVSLTDAWAVRSLSSDDVVISGVINTDTLQHETDTDSEIGVSNLTLTSGAATPATSLALAPQWDLQKGGISFTLDLSAADHAGAYTSAATPADATDTFLLTLTGN